MAKRIHFINVSKFDNIGDCILIENDGKYGLIDCGEGGQTYGQNVWIDHKVNGVTVPGVRTYLKKIMGDNNVFEFVALSHAHSDHIGAFCIQGYTPTQHIKNGLTTLCLSPPQYGFSEWRATYVLLHHYNDLDHLLDEYREAQSYDNFSRYYDAAKTIHFLHQQDPDYWNLVQDHIGMLFLGDLGLTVDYKNICDLKLDGAPQSDENIWSYIFKVQDSDTGKNCVLLGDYQNDIIDSYNGVARCNLEFLMYLNTEWSVENADLLKLGHHGLVNSGHDWTLKRLNPKCLVNSGPLNLLTTNNGIAGKYFTDEGTAEKPVGYQRFLTADELNIPIVSTTGEVYFKGTSSCIQKYPGVTDIGAGTFSQYCDAVVWDFADEIDESTIEPNTIYIYKNADGEIKVTGPLFGKLYDNQRVHNINYEGTTRSPGKNYDRVIYTEPEGKNIVAASVQITNEDDSNDRGVAHIYKDKLTIQSYNEGPDDSSTEGRKFKVDGVIITEDE